MIPLSPLEELPLGITRTEVERLFAPFVKVDDEAWRRRFAKRSDDVSLAKLRAAGLDPRALVAWVARRSGIEAPEPASARDFVPRFDMARVPREPVRCTPEALAELGL